MDPDLARFPIWDADPVLLRVGSAQLRVYSALLFVLFASGYAAFHWQMRRAGHGLVPTSRFLLWGTGSVLIAGHLGHCLFYEPDYYLRHPWQILDLRRGGLSSHAAFAGLALGVWLYARRYEYSWLEVWDRFAIGTVVGGTFIRIGNLFNSEIVGREWYGPWAVRFPRFADRLQAQWEAAHGPLGWTAQALPRHPTQVYEIVGMLGLLGILLAIDRHYGERRPRGVLFGALLTVYFPGRFVVEFFKEYQRFGELAPDPVEHVIRVLPSAGLTMGQWLSIPFFLIGLASLAYAHRYRLPAAQMSRFDVEPEAGG